MSRLSFLLLVVLAGCASTSGVATQVPVDTPVPPQPYTAAQIREANPPGTTLVFRLEAPDQPTVHNAMRFLSGDDTGCELEGELTQPDGTPLGSVERSTATWEELRDHASFPAERTGRRRDRCRVPAGTFDCWVYTVQGETTNAPTHRYHFAIDRPGPPVRYETISVDGDVLMRMTLVSDTRR